MLSDEEILAAIRTCPPVKHDYAGWVRELRILWGRAIESAATAPLLARIEEQDALIAKLRLEAQIHAQEARTANATIAEIYQSVTGGTGEPGNWHGAAPVKARIAALTRELEEARKDAERWNWLNWHIGVAWGEEGFTSLIRIVSEKHRALINAQVDKLMSGELPETPAIRAAIKEQT